MKIEAAQRLKAATADVKSFVADVKKQFPSAKIKQHDRWLEIKGLTDNRTTVNTLRTLSKKYGLTYTGPTADDEFVIDF